MESFTAAIHAAGNHHLSVSCLALSAKKGSKHTMSERLRIVDRRKRKGLDDDYRHSEGVMYTSVAFDSDASCPSKCSRKEMALQNLTVKYLFA